MKKPPIAAVIILLAAVRVQSIEAAVKLPAVLGSHTVLQQEMPIPKWGSADPTEKVTVRCDDTTSSTTADEDGRWKLLLPAMQADGKAIRLSITGSNTIVLEDLLIGDDSDEMHQLYRPIYDFGYGKPDCKVFPYWEPNQPLKLSGPNAKARLLACGGKGLVILTSFGEGGPVRLELDTNKVGVLPGFTATDAETGDSFKVNESMLTVELPRHDVRLIKVE